MLGSKSSRARLPKASTRWSYANSRSPPSVLQRSSRAAVFRLVTRPMMKRLWKSGINSSRSGATTGSGKIDAPTASGNCGLKVV